MARVAVQLRRGGQQATATLSASKGQGDEPAPVWSSASGLPSEERLAIGQWEVLPAAHVLRVAGEELELTRTEFALVELLARHPRRVFSKQALYEHVWGECYGGQESTISAHVSNLRTKLKPTGTDGYIQTVWGLGFRLVPPDNL